TRRRPEERTHGAGLCPRSRTADSDRTPIRLVLRTSARRPVPDVRLWPGYNLEAREGRAVADPNRVSLLHASPLRPRRRLPLSSLDAMGSEYREGKGVRDLWSKSYREANVSPA